MPTRKPFDTPFDLMWKRLESISDAAERDKLQRQLIAERDRRRLASLQKRWTRGRPIRLSRSIG